MITKQWHVRNIFNNPPVQYFRYFRSVNRHLILCLTQYPMILEIIPAQDSDGRLYTRHIWGYNLARYIYHTSSIRPSLNRPLDAQSFFLAGKVTYTLRSSMTQTYGQHKSTRISSMNCPLHPFRPPFPGDFHESELFPMDFDGIFQVYGGLVTTLSANKDQLEPCTERRPNWWIWTEPLRFWVCQV